ncbi:MAG: Tad domain-containing protein [Planctomycetaceae bacterium]
MRTRLDSTQRREGAESQGFQATDTTSLRLCVGASLRVISCSCRRPCKSSTGRSRSGYILVFFAMILFGIMAMAALVIDIGFARLTQQQMQTAVDAAAIEGLRFRDGIPDAWLNDPDTMAEIEAACGTSPPLPQDPNDPDWQTWLNCARRRAASRTVALVFDDDLDPLNGDDGAFYDAANPDPNAGEQFNVAGKFGAGPVLEFTGGEGSDPDLAASQFINDPDNPNSNSGIGSLPAMPVYKPTRSDGTPGLEFNIGDEIHGDMVARNYAADADHDDEGENYVRSDFQTAGDSAFLVRMRRTNNFEGLDADTDVSTHGPPLPFLFGRGSLAVRDIDMVSDYLPRRHGITVRGTGIADALPAMSVGLPDSTIMLPGLARFGLSRSEAWDRLIVDDPVTWSLSNGVISNPHGGVVGRFFSFGAIESMPVSIGREVPRESSPIDGTYTGYLPIYDEVDSVDRVVAFGIATAQASSAGATVTITREPARIASTNASAVLCYPRPAGTSVDEWRSVLDRILPVDASVGDVLLAPVSVR